VPHDSLRDMELMLLQRTPYISGARRITRPLCQRTLISGSTCASLYWARHSFCTRTRTTEPCYFGFAHFPGILPTDTDSFLPSLEKLAWAMQRNTTATKLTILQSSIGRNQAKQLRTMFPRNQTLKKSQSRGLWDKFRGLTELATGLYRNTYRSSI
jgi:hypothetical protein